MSVFETHIFQNLVADLAIKPLTPNCTDLGCACQPCSLTSATSSAYFAVFPSKAQKKAFTDISLKSHLNTSLLSLLND